MATPSAHHVGLTVSDLDRALDFYRDALGFTVLDEFSVAGDAFATAVDVPGASAEFVHLDADGVRLELVEYDPAAAARDAAALNEPGAAHVGLTVDDVEAFLADLPDSVPRLSDPQTTATGSTIAFLRDPDDHLVELLER